ncbi:HalOD1 output domain-containing protein [Haloarcula nitratireducens]|uniref:Halobacterial output domain-containing protein n=1 Tax=Haloarcula nitratireducens TaxID=2487749 RepID=A0AAW4PKW3_9EURY|nr:HalOD1 output domain-containing protein [Halomicroarcula nitratireducens]MBX0298213.1 hypothetical protein [Halomicroarcula nitratireducens]
MVFTRLVTDSISGYQSDQETNSTTVRHDWSQPGPPSVALVEAVAAATDRTTADLPLRHRSVDADAFDALLTSEESASVTVSFKYADTTVRVNRNGNIEIQIDGALTDGDDD